MTYAALQAGTTYGARVLKRGAGVELVGDDDQVVGKIDLKAGKPFEAALEAADGRWMANNVGGSKWKGPDGWSITDASGAEVATLDKSGAITGPGGPVAYDARGRKIDGLYDAKVGAMAKMLPGLSKTQFECEVTPALLARADASIVFLLAAWRTSYDISVKAATD